MPGAVALDQQYFDSLREKGLFYVDKTSFLRDWWNSCDTVTLITGLRSFGKTLMMSTAECFFFMKYAGRADLFEGLDVWKDEDMRTLQGAYPVIFLSLADVKPFTFGEMKETVFRKLTLLYSDRRRALGPHMDSAELADRGIPEKRIRKYGFAFRGREVLIGRA